MSLILRTWATLLGCIVLVVGFAGRGMAENRIALIIGNGGYESVGKLPNSVADANLMAETLQNVGFDVTLLTDADQNAMKRGIADFGRSLRKAGPDTVALFYYAGHAVQSFGNNYLLPVDSAIGDQADLDLVGVEAGWVLRQLYSARVNTNIVILDSCRNNPFGAIEGFDEQGLAEMSAPTGSFIAYSTAPGSVAKDGKAGQNSPYTDALATEIRSGPQSIEQLFKRVRIKVLEETSGTQTPWESSSLTSDFNFGTGNGSVSVPGVIVTDPPRAEASTQDLVTFTTPLPEGEPEVVGKSIEMLIKGQPLFPPFEGIPDELWKGQHCTNCHQWNKERLCEQANFYTTESAERSMQKQHPLGIKFKEWLRSWATAGCP